MKRFTGIALAAALALAPAGQAFAGWKLVKPATPTAVAKSTFTVSSGEEWNRNSYRPIKKSELWTLDGLALNEVYFVSGLIAGEPLYREVDKKNKPLPKMAKAMQLTDIPEFFESSQRVALNTSLFELTGTEPVKFAGNDGVRFTFEYAVQGNPMRYKGMAQAALVKGQLYLISYIAPSIYYFDRDRAKAEAIMASAKI
ncbi:MAG: hypothetical protein ACKOPQ_05405 [Novosphingobium sp.]